MEHVAEQFIITFNAVAPFFLIMFIGWLARRFGIAGEPFYSGINKLAFLCFFPALLFINMYTADLAAAFDLALVSYFILSLLAVYAVLWVVAARFVKDKLRWAVYVQAAYRCNYIVLAIPIIAALFEPGDMPRAALILPFLVTLNNIQTATLFVVAGQSSDISVGARVKGILIGIFKMPMIIAVLIGILVNVAGLSLPVVVSRSISSVSLMAAPAALLGVGGALSIEKVRLNLQLAIAATAAKNVLVPLALIIPAVLLGFRGVDLAIIALIGLTPVGPATYTTAIALGGPEAGEPAASCLVLSNALALFTIVPGLAILSILGLFL
ncbi:MAG: AEC family transporter [Oscillospiraceae bacterium]|nr:AEC family transporter [Oscillospiraceae bacterium]